MKLIVLVGTISFALGAFAANQWQGQDDSGPSPLTASQDESLVERVTALELRLAAAENQSKRLEAMLQGFAPETLGDAPGLDDSELIAPTGAGSNAEAAPLDRAERRRGRVRSVAQRRSALIDQGFDPATAEWIIQQESTMRMEAIRERYRARRNPESGSSLSSMFTAQQEFRQQLGEDGYEKYLQATGRPTRVMVSEVIPTSPAETAGLMPGDSIVSYGGDRVFNMGDLMRRTFEGVEGEPVLVEVDRQGVLTQFYLPRGPIGINGVGRRNR